MSQAQYGREQRQQARHTEFSTNQSYALSGNISQGPRSCQSSRQAPPCRSPLHTLTFTWQGLSAGLGRLPLPPQPPAPTFLCLLPTQHSSSPDLAVLLSILPVASLFRKAVLELKRDQLPKQAVARRHLLPVCSRCAKVQPKRSN